MLMLDRQLLPLLERECHRDHVDGEAIQLRIARVVVRARAVSIRAGISKSLFAGERHVAIVGFAGDSEEMMGAGSGKELCAEGISDPDFPILGGRRDVVFGRG